MVYDASMTRRVAPLVVVLAAGCASGGHRKTELPTVPPPRSSGPLDTAGPRCSGATCSCRAVDDYGRPTGSGSRDEGEIAAGMKRFEFRTGRGFDAMTVTIDGRGTLTKDASQAEPSCGYVELAPGRHAVRLRILAKDPAQGIHPRLLVNEYGRNTNGWYTSFSFACGAVGPCIKDDMKDWFDKARAVDRGIYDPCGATRVEGIRWSVEHSPEQTLEDLTLDLGAARLQVRAALRARHADVQGDRRRSRGRSGNHAGRREGGVTLRCAVVALLLVIPSLAPAQAAYLRERIDLEWVVATGGWRSAMGSSDARSPGFDALAGGSELVLGLEVGAGLAIVGDGRFLIGEAGGAHTFLEGLGSLALQLRLGRVRLRAGPTAGQARWRGDQATLVGGFVAGSIDVLPLGGGRMSTTVALRLDLDADVGAATFLPDASAALALGLGVRY